MKGKFRFKEGYTYNMPVHFRETPVEKANPVYRDVFVISVDITTDMDALAKFIPGDFEIMRPVVNIQYSDCRDVDWMSHGNYRLIQFGVPVRYLGNDEGLTGLYQLVLWEDKAEPMLTGRENTGQPKMYADLSAPRRWEDRWFVRASYEETTFLKLDFFEKGAAGEDELAAVNKNLRRVNTFGWRYITKIGAAGAALSHAVLNRSEALAEALWYGEAAITWTEYDWWENLIQCHIIAGLSSLPMFTFENATRMISRMSLLNTESRALESTP